MKITCRYCGNVYNDTKEKCPSCGGENDAVKRTADGQPLTIEELKKWYQDRGLPPYETTRFFIGVNYEKPKAFGIYKDDRTGNVVVYKNKASGERAVRYEGTDEAYAVNELLQRLKQEILEQKAKNGTNSSNRTKKGKKGGLGSSCLGVTVRNGLFLLAAGAGGLLLIFLVGLIALIFDDEPKTGYYIYENTPYYFTYEDYGDDGTGWYKYGSDGNWEFPVNNSCMPEVLQNKKTAKPFFMGASWKEDIGCTDFSSSVFRKDIDTGIYPDEGYYSLDSDLYYHIAGRFDEHWFIYSDDWSEMPFVGLPADMKHTSLLSEYYASISYTDELGCTDFADTVFYGDYIVNYRASEGYYRYDDRVYYSAGGDWYYYGDDDWYYAADDVLPYELYHVSLSDDFYFTPTWDSSTQFTDFTDTAFYSAYISSISTSSDNDSGNSWFDDDDSSYDWGGGDWDSGSSDWDSDW